MVTQMSKRAAARLDALLDPRFYRALCDPSRLGIVAWLAAQRAPRSVSDVAAGCCARIDLSVVSRHLATLRDAGILEAARDGKQVLYRLRTEWLVGMLRGVADAIEACCAPAPATRHPATKQA